MLRITHECIEYNYDRVLKFTPDTPDFIRRDIADTLEFALNDAQMIAAGDYIEASEYDDLKREKENFESKCEEVQYKLERLLSDIENVLEQGENEALKLVADDLQSVLEGLKE